ncbi:MAG: hypothetical protein ACLT1A_15255 [Dysosmobacter sp.]
MAQDKFGSSPQVVQAIARHTTGDRDMTTLDKIVTWLDCIEPGRDYPGVDRLRSFVPAGSGSGHDTGAERHHRACASRAESLDRRSQEALDDLRSKKENGK